LTADQEKLQEGQVNYRYMLQITRVNLDSVNQPISGNPGGYKHGMKREIFKK